MLDIVFLLHYKQAARLTVHAMKLPFFNELEPAQNILIAGAGGGFDVFCGLPFYCWLKRMEMEDR